MSLSLRRPCPAGIASSATIIAVFHGFAGPAAAQNAPTQKSEQLPAITVETKVPEAAKPKPPVKAATPKPQPATAPSAPSATPAPVAEAAPISDTTAPGAANPLANAGTPSAGVAPVFGAVGSPGAQTATGIDTRDLDSDPLFSVSDLLRQSPGVSVKQGNGPRDFGVSIRGSNARNGFGVRNIVVMEDGFPVTQPDGLSRTDLTDPHAYGGVDVWRGPSSAMFGNYATGGAINFRTRKGGDIDGVMTGSDVGSFNYFNNYIAGGTKTSTVEASVFASDVRGDGIFEYSAFDTQTINMLLTYQPNASDTFTFKGINNEIDTELPFRMSLSQYQRNPFQKGCAVAGGSVAIANDKGCAAQNFSATGNNNTGGDRVAQTAEQAGAGRDDRRTVAGFRWEHDVDADTSWRLQYVADDRNINQPTGTTSAIGDFFSHNIIADVSHRTWIAGLPSRYYLGFFWNHLPVDSETYNVAPGGNAMLGLLQSETQGSTTNVGARTRQELGIAPNWTLVAGLGVEKTDLTGRQTSFRYSVAGATLATTVVRADRSYTNAAPELGLLFRPNDALQLRARAAAGYGTPQFSNLFVTPTGEPGNNTELETQTNIGYDAGFDWTPTSGLSFSLTGFYEFFEDELVSQGTVPGRPNVSFNVPKSEHRGIEASIDAEFFEGWRLTTAYLYNDQIYTEYTERLTRAAGGGVPARTADLDRAGNKIPGVAPHELTARLAYDIPTGLFAGVGAFVEYQWSDGFYLDNGNILKVPGSESVNLNVHYRQEFAQSWVRSIDLSFEVKNVLDDINIGGANNIANTLDAAGNENPAIVLRETSGSIYAGPPRTYYGGVKLRF